MATTYGYCRISNPKQSIERQKRNILAAYPDAVLIEEEYTGRTFSGRKRFEKLMKTVQAGDTIVFDSVSRLSRNAQEGSETYLQLFNAGVQLVFLKEHNIDTAVYRNALSQRIEKVQTGKQSTDRLVNGMLELLNAFTADLAKEQIEISFWQAEKEVSDLRQRTREGLLTAKLSGRQLGLPKGSSVTTKKEKAAAPLIRKYSRRFEGQLNDQETAKQIGISRQTVAKYIARLLAEDQEEAPDGDQ